METGLQKQSCQTLNVLYQSDDNYAVFLGVSICSLLGNNRSAADIHIYIIDDSISRENKNKLTMMIHSYKREVTFFPAESILGRKEIVSAFDYTGMRKNKHSYLKMFIDEFVPDLDKRILYIDCDTAITGDLTELMSIDMLGKPIGMVMDSLTTTKCKKAVGISKEARYFNSGVILIDLSQYKKRGCSKRILSHIKDIRMYGTVDQDVLNVELEEEILTLPIEYNLQPIHFDYPYRTYARVYCHQDYYTPEEIEKAVNAPKIVHYLRYLGEEPWNERTLHPCAKYFDYYLQASPWKDYHKKPANVKWIFRMEKWMYKYLPKGIFLRVFSLIHEAMIVRSNSFNHSPI